MSGREDVAPGVRAELRKLKATTSVEGRIALSLAKALDDRVGSQSGGMASTAKALDALMDKIRDRHKPTERTELELLRGGLDETG